jgi:hypothetical protein
VRTHSWLLLHVADAVPCRAVPCHALLCCAVCCRGIESCGILAGRLSASDSRFTVTTLIVPKQVCVPVWVLRAWTVKRLAVYLVQPDLQNQHSTQQWLT